MASVAVDATGNEMLPSGLDTKHQSGLPALFRHFPLNPLMAFACLYSLLNVRFLPA